MSNELLVKANQLEKGVYKPWLDSKTTETSRNRQRAARNITQTERPADEDQKKETPQKQRTACKEEDEGQKEHRKITEKQEDYRTQTEMKEEEKRQFRSQGTGAAMKRLCELQSCL